MPAFKYPLIEKRPHVFPGRFLNGVNEIDGLHPPCPVAREVEVHRAPPPLFPQLPADHVQDARPLFVEVAVKKIVGVLVEPCRQRPAIPLFVLVKISFGIAAELIDEFIMAPVVFRKERLKVSGETLV